MIFYYVRHGDPIYSPDSLTPLGIRQADAVSKRLALYGLDKVYASTSNRAIMTAQPTCDLLGLKPELLDFANEGHTWNELTIGTYENGDKMWLFQNKKIINLFNDKSIRELGDRWYDHPELEKYNYGLGIERIYNASDEFFKSLGYEHIRYSGKYRIIEPNNQRIALFAHQGFGLAFLSCLLDVPYPMLCTHFDMCHTGVTVIEFTENEAYSVPKVLTLSSDSHLYREGLPTLYNHSLYF